MYEHTGVRGTRCRLRPGRRAGRCARRRRRAIGPSVDVAAGLWRTGCLRPAEPVRSPDTPQGLVRRVQSFGRALRYGRIGVSHAGRPRSRSTRGRSRRLGRSRQAEWSRPVGPTGRYPEAEAYRNCRLDGFRRNTGYCCPCTSSWRTPRRTAVTTTVAIAVPVARLTGSPPVKAKPIPLDLGVASPPPPKAQDTASGAQAHARARVTEAPAGQPGSE